MGTTEAPGSGWRTHGARALGVFGLIAFLPLFRYGKTNPHGGAVVVVVGILLALSLITLAVLYLALEWWQRRRGGALLDDVAKVIFVLMLLPFAALVWVLVIATPELP